VTRPTDVAGSAFAEVTDLPPFRDVDPTTLYAIRLGRNTTGLTHGLHRFPAKFIPHIPRWAIREFARKPNDLVLDPFMGSGTTLVEAAAQGVRAIGIDLDPLNCLIARAKTNPPSARRLESLRVGIKRNWTRPKGRLRTPMPDIENFDHWFSKEAWRELQGLLNAIDSVSASERERTFLLALFSSTVRWVSNADDQTQKTYVSGTNPKVPQPVQTVFWRFFDRTLSGIREFDERARQIGPARAIVADARATGLPESSVDLIVTSPPYLDSVDYMYNFMLEYFWLGPRLGIPDRAAFNRLRREPVGAKNPISRGADLPSSIAELIYFNGISVGRKRAAVEYFAKMQAHFREAARVTRIGGHYVLVIGNSQTTGGIIPVHDCLIRLASESGFELKKAFAYRVRRHYMKFPRRGRGGIIVLDWVTVLKRSRETPHAPARLPLPWLTLSEHAVAN
jgi:hypothetical protein